MSYKITISAILFILLPSMSFLGQDSLHRENVLILRKKKSSKRVYYHKNKTIFYKSEDTIRFGVINQINTDSILIDSTWNKYESISTVINPYSRNFIKSGSVMLPIAGITFAFITTFNAIINRDKPIFYREHLIPSAGLVGLGALMWPFRTQKYRMKRKWEFVIMPS